MIGRSDFIPVANIESSANQRALELLQPSAYKNSPAPTDFGKSSFVLEDTSKLLLASEHSEAPYRLPKASNKDLNPFPRDIVNDFNFQGDDGDRTNTMDFIDKMLNKGE